MDLLLMIRKRILHEDAVGTARREKRGGSRLAGLLPLLCLMLLAGCGGQGAKEKPQEQTIAEEEQSQEETTAEDGQQEEAAAEERPLHIVEDNYRNYYEIFVYSFYDSDGDGIGDLNGVTKKLDYIAELGFNGIWLMPVMPSPTYHKYDVTDYLAVDKAYGTMEDFERLTQECHKRNIRLVIDMVINHTSSKHPWFLSACSYLRTLPAGEEPDPAECPYVGYYHFSREKVNGSYYGVVGSDWYYEGSFWSEMPDLDLANEALRGELEEISAFWIGKGVDGFRMDAALHYEEGDTAFNTEALNWIFSYCRSLNPDFYMVSEVWAGRPVIAGYYASMTPSMFNFDLADAEGKLIKAARGKYGAEDLVRDMAAYQTEFAGKNPDYIDAPFISNHDTGRIYNALLADEKDIKMAAGLLLTMNGSPFVYYGEEIGMASKGTKDENKRLPMNWSGTDDTGRTKGPADADSGIKSNFPGVEEQLADEGSILNYYRRALRLRNENPELARGYVTVVDALCDGKQAAVLKTWEESVIAVVYNTADEEALLQLDDTPLQGMEIRGVLTLDGEAISLEDGRLTMPGQSICILKAP